MLGKWIEYFKDLLNPVTLIPSDTNLVRKIPWDVTNVPVAVETL